MIMAKTRSARTIKVSKENKAKLAKMFDCTDRMVYKALCFECQTLLARKIQYVARKEMGGWVEAAVPEDEILYDTMDSGERFMRQYFNNGAVLEISMTTGEGVVRFKGSTRYRYEEVLVSDIPTIQNYARNLKKEGKMEYYGNRLCISARELVDGGVMSIPNYKAMASRGRIDVVRRGGGAAGQYALVAVESLPRDYRAKVQALYPDGDLTHLKGWVCSNYEIDQAAVAFFHSREQAGLDLPPEKIKEYVVNASVLNCCIRLYERAATAQKLFGGKYNWEQMANAITALREEYGHTLPTSTLRFRKKVNEYKKEGYSCLISGKFGNQSARKVDYKTERLILGLAVLPNKPFNTNIAEMYNMFVCGELDVYDPKTGELMNPEDFVDKKTGEPKELSESTITNYLNKPANKTLIEHSLMSWTTFMHEQMPHVHRHGGDFSLSQITMDDVDLTRKLKDTKQRVHAYYAYDVVSQCVVGASYARKKDEGLVVDCFRDMFRLIEKQGWGMPAGIEVENHLMTQYKDGFLQAGVAFPFVQLRPQNSQEKYAEPLNGAKKRSVIHKNHEGIGRFYGKGKWRQEYKKVSDETNELYEDKEYFSWDQLVAEDRRDSYEWNHQLHPNQKKLPGMTRWTFSVSASTRPCSLLTN